jgi:hypothetical protein
MTNNSKADLIYQEPFIALEVRNDGEGNSLCSIVLDDKQELVLTAHEILGLYHILHNDMPQLKNYFNETIKPFMEGYEF